MCESESMTSRAESFPKTDEHLRENGSSFKPKTPLGRRLWSIRKRIIASDEALLGWDEIEKEVAARRGETD